MPLHIADSVTLCQDIIFKFIGVILNGSKKKWHGLLQEFKVSANQIPNFLDILDSTYRIQENNQIKYTKIPLLPSSSKKEKYNIEVENKYRIASYLNQIKTTSNEVQNTISQNIDILSKSNFDQKIMIFRNSIENINTKLSELYSCSRSIRRVTDILLESIESKSEKNKDSLLSEFKLLEETFSRTQNQLFNIANQLANSTKLFSTSLNQFIEETNELVDSEYNRRINLEVEHSVSMFKKQVEQTLLEFKNKKSELELDIKKSESVHKNIQESYKNISKDNSQLINSLTNYKKQLDNLKAANETEIEQALKGFKNIYENQCKDLIAEIRLQEDNLRTQHKDFITLVERAGIYELTQNYQKKAQEEREDYKINNWLTIGSIAAAIITTVIIIIIPIIEYWGKDPAVDINYFTILARLTISLMFFVLAIYTAKQAAKHYECYQENHRTYLQLAALEPFISRMSDEDKLEIRKILVPVYFNQNPDGKYATQGEEVYFPLIVDKIVDAVKEKIK